MLENIKVFLEAEDVFECNVFLITKTIPVGKKLN